MKDVFGADKFQGKNSLRFTEWRLLHPILNVSHNYRERDLMRANVYTLNGRELCLYTHIKLHT